MLTMVNSSNPWTQSLQAALRQARSRSDAARICLRWYKHDVHDYIAQAVVDAVHGYADIVIDARTTVERHLWQIPDGREYTLQRLRHQLLDDIISQGCVPTALPTQTIRYVTWTGSEPPAQPGDPEPALWDHVEVVLSAPVRVPPIDRKAAVRAGMLPEGA